MDVRAGVADEIVGRVTAEGLVSLVAAFRAVGRSIHPRTALRIVLRGSYVRGERVLLDAVKLGGRWLTSEAAVRRYLAGTLAAARNRPVDDLVRPQRTPTLDRFGLGRREATP